MGEGASSCKVQRHSAVRCAKTAEPIKMPFEFWARVGSVNHVLDWSPEVLMDVTMVTNFGTQFAIACFMALMGYNFGCMIASDTLFDSVYGWVFGLKLSQENIAEIECLRVVAVATNFGTKIVITGFRENDSD